MSSIITRTGIWIDPTCDGADKLDIHDIIHALSLLCRANGHFRSFYSVAQHSIACAKEAIARGLSDAVALATLLHDASEAYLSDVTRPIKKDLPAYIAAEERLQGLIWRHFLGRDLTQAERSEVFRIDGDMLSLEFHLLLPEDHGDGYKNLLTSPDCREESFASVRREMLSLFYDLCPKRLPSREEAERIVAESEAIYPGPWGDHCRTAAQCAERIAFKAGMDPEKAYILGLLHDIGRRFGHRHMGHVIDGYRYMMSLGYMDAARICLTHSFHDGTTDLYIGQRDTSETENYMIESALEACRMDDYDRLLQLCDALAGAGVILDIEERMADVKRRYGSYPQYKWDFNLYLKTYFEEKCHEDLYKVVGK